MISTPHQHPHPGLKQAKLLEISWEVCNQLGGIYTVIRSKLSATVDKWGDNYVMVGPWVDDAVQAEFDPINDAMDYVGRAVNKMRAQGYEILYGRWLVTGRPRVVLLKPAGIFRSLQDIKAELQDPYGIPDRPNDPLYDEALLWCEQVRRFLKICHEERDANSEIIAHFHEWMSATPILGMKKDEVPIKTVFTTHATMLGRVLAMNDSSFYENLEGYDDDERAAHFHLKSIHGIEKAAAQNCDCFTTVSEITALECEHLLGRKPDKITPNGLNIARFATNHEVQLQHAKYKERIHEFIMGHFFHSYSFDLDKTLYFFTSGRFEYRNKGFDLVVAAMERLNRMLIEAGVDITVVLFVITKKEVHSINPDVLEARGVLNEMHANVHNIAEQIKDRLFHIAAASDSDHRLPDLNEMVDDYWKLRYRRTIQSWKSKRWPIVVTHNLKDDHGDELLNDVRSIPLVNSPLDRVKIVYHPDFIKSTNPLFGIDYDQFVRGCHLGIFPSYYEPWGYTPLECIARGVPAVTSDLSGFGAYVQENKGGKEETGVYVLKRHKIANEESIDDLARFLFEFSKTSTRYRTILRNKLEDYSERFDWRLLTLDYDEAYDIALGRQAELV